MNDTAHSLQNIETEIIYSIVTSDINCISFKNHFLPEKTCFIDNINGRFDSCDNPIVRELGVGTRFGTWSRARAIISALTDELNLFPVLGFNPPNKLIKGLGFSDDDRYANQLEYLFDYTNTFLHKDPHLNIMEISDDFLQKKFG